MSNGSSRLTLVGAFALVAEVADGDAVERLDLQGVGVGGSLADRYG